MDGASSWWWPMLAAFAAGVVCARPVERVWTLAKDAAIIEGRRRGWVRPRALTAADLPPPPPPAAVRHVKRRFG